MRHLVNSSFSSDALTETEAERGSKKHHPSSRFTAASFSMAFRQEENLYVDTDCQINPFTQGVVESEDYLYIPESETADGLRGSKFCGGSADGQIIACK